MNLNRDLKACSSGECNDKSTFRNRNNSVSVPETKNGPVVKVLLSGTAQK